MTVRFSSARVPSYPSGETRILVLTFSCPHCLPSCAQSLLRSWKPRAVSLLGRRKTQSKDKVQQLSPPATSLLLRQRLQHCHVPFIAGNDAIKFLDFVSLEIGRASCRER